MAFETAFTMDTSSIRYGPGVTREVGYEMARLGASCVMLVVDPHLVESEAVATAHSSLLEAGIEVVVFDGVRCEPTDVSFKAAIRFASEGNFDGYVAVGGVAAPGARVVAGPESGGSITDLNSVWVTDAAGYYSGQLPGLPYVGYSGGHLLRLPQHGRQ